MASHTEIQRLQEQSIRVLNIITGVTTSVTCESRSYQRDFLCEDSQSSQKQLQRQQKFKKIAKLLSAHIPANPDSGFVGDMGR